MSIGQSGTHQGKNLKNAVRKKVWLIWLIYVMAVLALDVGFSALNAASGGGKAPLERLTEALGTAYTHYKDAPREERDGLLKQLVHIASERAGVLKKAMESDPKEALRFAIPASRRAALPPKVQAYVEDHVGLEGTLTILFEDRYSASRYVYFLDAGDQHYKLHPTTEPPAGWLTGARVRVKGVRLGNDVVF